MDVGSHWMKKREVEEEGERTTTRRRMWSRGEEGTDLALEAVVSSLGEAWCFGLRERRGAGAAFAAGLSCCAGLLTFSSAAAGPADVFSVAAGLLTLSSAAGWAGFCSAAAGLAGLSSAAGFCGCACAGDFCDVTGGTSGFTSGTDRGWRMTAS